MADFKNDINNISNLAEQLDKIMKLSNQAFSQLTPEQYEKVKDYHSDSNEMVREFKKGNFENLDKFLKKYKS